MFFSDGRLRIDDEIVNVNGHHLRGSLSLEAAHKFLQIFVNGSIDLVVAYDFPLTESVTRTSLRNREKSCDGESKYDDSWDRLSEIPTGLENGIILQRFKKMRHDGQLSRRSSLNKALSLTPLQHSTEYTPVYANRVTNAIDDDRKKKMNRNSIHIDDCSSNSYGIDSKEVNDKILNDSMYALYRPPSCKTDCNEFRDKSISTKCQSKENEFGLASSFDHQIDGEVKRKNEPIDTNAVDGKKIAFLPFFKISRCFILSFRCQQRHTIKGAIYKRIWHEIAWF